MQILFVVLLVGLLAPSSAAPQKAFRFLVNQSEIKSLAVKDLLKILGEGALSPEYMKIFDSDKFDPVERNEGQTCESKEFIEDRGDNYFPRYIRDVVCTDTGKSCNPTDGSFTCVKTTIVKHVLKREDRLVLVHITGDGTTEYYDLWNKHQLEVGVGCECSS